MPKFQVSKFANAVGLLDLLGGLILTIVLGLQAWKQTPLGRQYRLCAGALAVGVFLGYICYAVCSDLLTPLIDSPARGWIAFTAFPILLLAATFYLESLRTKLERGTGTGDGRTFPANL